MFERLANGLRFSDGEEKVKNVECRSLLLQIDGKPSDSIKEHNMITELREVIMNTPTIKESEPLLSIHDLHVWYELRRFGFGHAGYVKAVDGDERRSHF